MYIIIENDKFLGFSLKEEQGYKNVEITEKEHTEFIEKQSEGYTLYWNKKQLEAIKLDDFEYINDQNEIIKNLQKIKENIKNLITIQKEKIIENGFEIKINGKTLIQKCREKDKTNILGTLQLMESTGQKTIDWKFIDENNNDVMEQVTKEFLNNMLIQGAVLTSKAIHVEQQLFTRLETLNETELLNFNVSDEFKKLMGG